MYAKGPSRAHACVRGSPAKGPQQKFTAVSGPGSIHNGRRPHTQADQGPPLAGSAATSHTPAHVSRFVQALSRALMSQPDPKEQPKAAADAEIGGVPDTQTGLPAEQEAGLPGLVKQRLIGLRALYTTKDTKEQDNLIDAEYDAKTIFDDNIMHVHGAPSMKVQFHALAKCFKSCSLKPTSYELTDEGTGKRLKVMNDQAYVVGGRTIGLKVETILQMNSDGRITKHQDTWQDSYNNFGFIKRLIGSSSSAILRMIKY